MTESETTPVENTSELEAEVSALKDKIKASREGVADKLLVEVSQTVDVLSRIKLKARRTLNGHAAAIYTLSWRADSHEMVSGSQDGKLLIWDTQTNNKLNIITLKCPWVMSSSYAASGNFVACGGHDNAISVFSMKGGATPERPLQELTDHQGFISCLEFLDDSQILASSGDQSVALWNVEGGQKIASFEGHQAEVMGHATTADKTKFVSGSCDMTAKLWDIRADAGKRCCQTFTGHELDINSICMFPSDNAFATGSDDNSCKVFDIRSDQFLATYSQNNLSFGIAAVAFSRSGRLLFVACDYDVLIWDTLKCMKVGILSGHENRVHCLGVNTEGNAVCSGSWDSKLKIWN